MEDRPRLGLVLGAGSARGLAHIGVLQVFQENRVPFDFIVGSSMGALVGALAASGADLYLLGKLTYTLNFNSIIDIAIPRMGFIAGKKLEQFLRLMTKNATFDQLKFPLHVVATDLKKGEPVVISQGPVWQAVRASTAIPGVFRPWIQDDLWLVDGAVTARLPVEIARDLGADLVVAVDVTFTENRQVKIKSTLDVILQSIEIMERKIFENLVRDKADILIQPPVGNIDSSGFDHAEECIEKGRNAAIAALPLIRERLGPAPTV